ncbi:MAG: hypothetical protein P1U86_17090 [Verrucomicrobiales bacterium]|nr:hypothetical protein [Verrucomicrobiales bacterium]
MKTHFQREGRFSRLSAFRPLFVWGLLCLSGFTLLANYVNTPGPQTLPDESVTGDPASTDGGAQVFMFIHPKCPCSKASLTELQEVVQRASGHIGELRFYVTVSDPESSGNWREEGLIRQLQSWGGNSSVYFDSDGETARRYGALTSGHVVAFDANGEQIFTGGITGSRGHRGDNRGRRELVSALTDHQDRSASSLVFGCQIQSFEEAL